MRSLFWFAAKITKKKANHHPPEVIAEAETTRDALCHALGLYPAKAVETALKEAPIWPPLSNDELHHLQLLIETNKKDGWDLETALDDGK